MLEAERLTVSLRYLRRIVEDMRPSISRMEKATLRASAALKRSTRYPPIYGEKILIAQVLSSKMRSLSPFVSEAMSRP